MQIMFSHELQRRLRLAGKDVDCFAVHPGEAAAGGLSVGGGGPFHEA
jgi:hypothetical protein